MAVADAYHWHQPYHPCLNFKYWNIDNLFTSRIMTVKNIDPRCSHSLPKLRLHAIDSKQMGISTTTTLFPSYQSPKYPVSPPSLPVLLPLSLWLPSSSPSHSCSAVTNRSIPGLSLPFSSSSIGVSTETSATALIAPCAQSPESSFAFSMLPLVCSAPCS